MTDRTADIPLRWIDDAPPEALPTGTMLGMPFGRGELADVSTLSVIGDGERIPSQHWPLATWPDGSVKWAGVALGAGAAPADVRVRAGGEVAAPVGSAPVVTVREEADAVVIDTGALVARIPRSGRALIASLEVGGTVVATDGRLVSSVQGTPEPDHATREHCIGELDAVDVEQSGPVRAVVKVTGRHRSDSGERAWLPFTVRLSFAAGATAIRMVHSFIWDGDADRDFLSSLGVAFTVPLRAEPHDRHVRFAGADGGFLREAVRGLTGMRRDPGPEVRQAQLAGRATPAPETWARDVGRLARWIPTWSDYSLRQHAANGFSLRKRTAAGHGWVGIAEGTRSEGLVYVGDPSGGLSVGIRSFWQSFPGQLDLRGAADATAEVTAWLYAPDAEPMDLRFYHDGLGQQDYTDQLEALEITYEDYQPGFGDAHGIARTHELVITAWPATPDLGALRASVDALQRPAQLAATPERFRQLRVFGDWALPAPPGAAGERETELETRLGFLLDFYLGQVDQRSWYGFWNYGDVMHAYDVDRHTWRYDVGGYAWDNSELSPDLWLWTAFLRTGRGDVFRLAEAMTRHTGDVDVYHAGRFQGLGSRHNVQHWGCSAKQLRISSPVYRRMHHLLTADEHTRDLILELRDSDATFLTLDPTRKVRPDAATYRPDRGALAIGLGTDWSALAATWLADWELTGDERSRDRLLGTMRDIGALRHGFLTGEALYDLDTGRFDTTREQLSVSHLSAVFGLVEVVSELIDLVDEPAFEAAWLQYCRMFLATPEEQIAEVGQVLGGRNLDQAHSRLLAYAAARLDRPDLADRAWAAYFGGGEFMGTAAFEARRIEPPEVLSPVDEALTLSTNDAAQFSLATMQNLALIRDRLDLWDTRPTPPVE